MSKVIFHRQAERDMLDAEEYYNTCQEGLGEAFIIEVKEKCALLLLNTNLGSRLKSPYKRLLLTRFPYGLIYLQVPEGIFIIAIMHLKRKPGYWLKRIK